jgi:hypothetical protein
MANNAWVKLQSRGQQHNSNKTAKQQQRKSYAKVISHQQTAVTPTAC